MKNNTVTLFIRAMLLWIPFAWSLPPAQVDLAVTVDSVARVALYYQDKPVLGNKFYFSLPVNGISQKFESTSGFFHIVGNVGQVGVMFEEETFILNQVSGGDSKVNLAGNFIFRGNVSEATKTLRVPVINSISQATTQNGLKLHFVSEFLAGHYTKGQYANTFTLLLTPII